MSSWSSASITSTTVTPTTTASSLRASATRVAVASRTSHHDLAITNDEVRLAGSRASPLLCAELELALALGVGEVLLDEDPAPPLRLRVAPVFHVTESFCRA